MSKCDIPGYTLTRVAGPRLKGSSLLGAVSTHAPARREQLRPVVLEWEDDHAVEVDLVKTHRRDKSLDRGGDLAAGFAPRIERALQATRVVGHDEIRAQRETVRLGSEFFIAPTAGGPGTGFANLALQLMGAFVVVQVP